MRALLVAAVLVLAGFVLFLINGSRCRYYVYKNIQTGEENVNVSYEKFGSGYIKYSNNGIEYQKSLGRSEWNSPDSFSHPFVRLSKDYILLGDKGSNSLKLFDRKGEVYSYRLRYPLEQASVSDDGYVEVILRGGNGNYIQVYDKEGQMIAEMKASIDNTGYPLTAAISPEGSTLVVSYFKLNGMQSENSVVFYDLSKQTSSDNARKDVTAGYDYDDVMIPTMEYLDKNTLACFGDGKVILYNVGKKISVKKEIKFSRTIQSVFFYDDIFGLVLDNTGEMNGKRYQIALYNRNGRRTLVRDIDMNYSKIRMWGNEIYAYNDTECLIMSKSGKLEFSGELEGNTIEAVIPLRGWRTYKVVFRDKTVDMQLRFWKMDFNYFFLDK